MPTKHGAGRAITWLCGALLLSCPSAATFLPSSSPSRSSTTSETSFGPCAEPNLQPRVLPHRVGQTHQRTCGRTPDRFRDSCPACDRMPPTRSGVASRGEQDGRPHRGPAGTGGRARGEYHVAREERGDTCLYVQRHVMHSAVSEASVSPAQRHSVARSAAHNRHRLVEPPARSDLRSGRRRLAGG